MEEKHKRRNGSVLNKITPCLALSAPTGTHTRICEARKPEGSISDAEDRLRRRKLGWTFYAGCETLTSDSGVAAAALGQDLTEQVLAATASVVAVAMVAPFHAGA